jgi:hypothetical protein
VFDPFARYDVLQALFFAILFGVAIALVGAPAKPISEFVEAISRVLFRIRLGWRNPSSASSFRPAILSILMRSRSI